MDNLKQWIEKHPYLSGVLVVAVFVLVYLYRRSSETATAQGTTVVQGSSGPSDALQAAQLQAQLQTHALDVQSALGEKQLDVALQGKQSDNATALAIANLQAQVASGQSKSNVDIAALQTGAATNIAGIQAGATVQVADIQAKRDLGIAGIQGQVSLANIAAALQAKQVDDATSLGLAQISANRDITLGGYAKDVAIHGQDTALAGLQNTNATDIQLANIQSATALGISANQTGVDLAQISAALQLGLGQQATDVTINQQNTNAAVTINKQNTDASVALGTAQINAQEGIINNFIGTQGQIDISKINFENNLFGSAFNLVQSGQLNKGGEGGANQVAFLTTLFGNPAAGVAAENTAVGTSTGNTWGSILTGFGNLFKGLFGTGGLGTVAP